MHSRIFQLTKEPLAPEEYISEGDFYEHWFLDTIADYVSDACIREEDIEWLKKRARGYRIASDDNGIFLEVYSKEEYFEFAYQRFYQLIKKIERCTLAEFANGIDGMFELKDAYDDRFSFYVYSDDEDDDGGNLDTFDSFIRGAEIGVKYYIGGTVDYHW